MESKINFQSSKVKVLIDYSALTVQLYRLSIQVLKPEPLYGYSMETVTLTQPPSQMIRSSSDLRYILSLIGSAWKDVSSMIFKLMKSQKQRLREAI